MAFILLLNGLLWTCLPVSVSADEGDMSHCKLEKQGNRVKWIGRAESKLVKVNQVYKDEEYIAYNTVEGIGITSNETLTRRVLVSYDTVEEKVYGWDKDNGRLVNKAALKKTQDEFPGKAAKFTQDLAAGLVTSEGAPQEPTEGMFTVEPIQVITGTSLKSDSQVRGRNTAIEQALKNKGAEPCGDYVWLDGVNEPGEVILPGVYDVVYTATGSYDNPVINFIGTNPSPPYYRVIGGRTHVYVSHFSGVGGTWEGSTLVLSYDFSVPLTSTTIYDDTANITGTVTFRSVSSDEHVSATLMSLLPVEEADAPAYTLDDPADFITSTPSITGNFTYGAGNATYPGRAIIREVAIAAATPEQLPTTIIFTFILLVISLGTSAAIYRHGSRSLLLKSSIVGVAMGVYVAFGVYDVYQVYFFAIIAIGVMWLSRQREAY